MEQPLVVSSAHKHGCDKETILHAFNNPIRSEDLDERLTMIIGPGHDGQVYEIGVVSSDEGPIIVHAMLARAKYLR